MCSNESGHYLRDALSLYLSFYLRLVQNGMKDCMHEPAISSCETGVAATEHPNHRGKCEKKIEERAQTGSKAESKTTVLSLDL